MAKGGPTVGKVLVAIVLPVVGIFLARTYGVELAERYNATGTVKRQVESVTNLDVKTALAWLAVALLAVAVICGMSLLKVLFSEYWGTSDAERAGLRLVVFTVCGVMTFGLSFKPPSGTALVGEVTALALLLAVWITSVSRMAWNQRRG